MVHSCHGCGGGGGGGARGPQAPPVFWTGGAQGHQEMVLENVRSAVADVTGIVSDSRS